MKYQSSIKKEKENIILANEIGGENESVAEPQKYNPFPTRIHYLGK